MMTYTCSPASITLLHFIGLRYSHMVYNRVGSISIDIYKIFIRVSIKHPAPPPPSHPASTQLPTVTPAPHIPSLINKPSHLFLPRITHSLSPPLQLSLFTLPSPPISPTHHPSAHPCLTPPLNHLSHHPNLTSHHTDTCQYKTNINIK